MFMYVYNVYIYKMIPSNESTERPRNSFPGSSLLGGEGPGDELLRMCASFFCWTNNKQVPAKVSSGYSNLTLVSFPEPPQLTLPLSEFSGIAEPESLLFV